MVLKISSIAVVLLMITGSMLVLSAPSHEVQAAPPSRWADHSFVGYIKNYTAVEGATFTVNISATGTVQQPPPNLPITLGPFYGSFQPATFEFAIPVDITQGQPGGLTSWDIVYTDRYGWNESSNGQVRIVPNDDFYKTDGTGDYVYRIENDTAEQPHYMIGKWGGLKFKVYNGSSGAPLPGVPFVFPKHGLHSSATSHNVTDANGEVTFRNMQMGLDADNKVRVEFAHPHFQIDDKGTAALFLPLHEDTITTYSVTLMEKPLVRSVMPADGSAGVKNGASQINLGVRFNSFINTSSVTSSTVNIKDGLGANVPVTFSFNNDSTSTWVYMTPNDDLKFNETYTITVTTGIRDRTGNHPLWRTFTSTFTTWKAPAVLRGTVYIFGTGDPAPAGTVVNLDGLTPQATVDGAFVFDKVTDGNHTLQVVGPEVGGVAEYMYYGMTSGRILALRGYDLEVQNLVVYKRPTVSMTVIVTDPEATPLEGATVTDSITGESKVAGADGSTFWPSVRANFTIKFVVEAPNYVKEDSYLTIGTTDGGTFTVSLQEMDLPVNITARSGVDVDLEEGAVIPIDSIFVLSFNSPMNLETMSQNNIKVFDSEMVPIDITIVNETKSEKRWYVTPDDYLLNGEDYSFFISRYVAYKTGDNPLWRNLTIDFSTVPLIDSSISGRVMINDKGIEGLDLQVRLGEEVLATAVTAENGAYSLNVPMAVEEYNTITVVVSGAKYGLSDGLRQGITLRENEATEDVDIEMDRLPGWVSITYTMDDQDRVVRGSSILVEFTKEIDDATGFEGNFTIGNLALGMNITEDGKGVWIQPLAELEYNKEYFLSVSLFPDTDYYKELRFADGTPALIRGESYSFKTEFKPVIVTLQSPAGDTLDAVPKGEKFILRFSDAVNTELVEDALSIKRVSDGLAVTGLQYEWRDENKAVEVSHDDFRPTTRYELRIAAGDYGVIGSKLIEDFVVSFTSAEGLIITLRPLPNLPSDSQEPGQITVHLVNPVGYSILVVIGYRLKDTTLPFTELANITLSPLEADRSVVLDLSDVAEGQYEIRVWVRDAVVPESVLNEYPLFLTINEKSNPGGPGATIVIVVLVLLLLVILAVAAFIYLQTRKKQEADQEAREEFECPECHHTVGVEDSVCPNCGAEFEEEAYKCPKCGHMLDPEDEECGECGYDFSEQEKMEIDTDDYEVADDEDEEIEELVEMEE